MNKISKEEASKLFELFKTAQTTPVISLTGRPEDDWSKCAWDKVGTFQQLLGKKYHYNWESCAINRETGEIVKI